MRLHLTCFFLLPVFTLLAANLQADTYSYPQLVQQMTDLHRLATLPSPGEKTGLASSYDRRSRYDAAADHYIDWDANGDGGGIIRKEGNESVLAEIQGPGCLRRIWSATTGKGHVKIYLDGSDTPAVDLPFADYFSGQVAPFNRPHIAYALNGKDEPPGSDNFTPIPFQKSCKVVADPGWGNYYQFTYAQYPDGTVVPTFRMNLSAEDSAALDKAEQILAHCGDDPAPPDPSAHTDRQTIKVASGQEAVVADLTGPEAITALKVKLDLPGDAEEQRMLLRQLTVSITWDDQPSPSVWSPLGDFFGYVGGAVPYRSLPLGLMPDGTFYSYWYMPFAKKAHLVVGNDGPRAVSLDWEITHAPLTSPPGQLTRFHAKWHRDAFPPARDDRKIDWTLLTTTGRGRFVGTHLHGWNPEGGWWGEGDDKFFVDGEKFPSTFGTGSEDYFGYAWSSDKIFSRPYHNQILNEGNGGHFDDNRWHITDAVPFQTSFEGDLEKYFSNEQGTLFAAEVYWYLDAAGQDPYGPAAVDDRAGYWTQATMVNAPGTIEAERLRNMDYGSPWPEAQDMTSFGTGWSGDKQLFWRPPANKALVLPIYLMKGGKYHLYLRCTKAPDYGIVQFSLNGKDLGAPFDGYAATVVPADEIDLGVQDLTRGLNRLRILMTGKSDASTNTYFGLDYIRVIPEP